MTLDTPALTQALFPARPPPRPQDVKCVVAGVPKSIDNDILLIDKCFGFDTAVEEAQRALLAAKVGQGGVGPVGWWLHGTPVVECMGGAACERLPHAPAARERPCRANRFANTAALRCCCAQVEAVSGCRGLGIVKLMGRNSGFIAMQASMASGVVDVCLIPEVCEGPRWRAGLGVDRCVAKSMPPAQPQAAGPCTLQMCVQACMQATRYSSPPLQRLPSLPRAACPHQHSQNPEIPGTRTRLHAAARSAPAPQITFTMPKLIAHVKSVLERKGHCVVCVAEGAGQVRGERRSGLQW